MQASEPLPGYRFQLSLSSAERPQASPLASTDLSLLISKTGPGRATVFNKARSGQDRTRAASRPPRGACQEAGPVGGSELDCSQSRLQAGCPCRPAVPMAGCQQCHLTMWPATQTGSSQGRTRFGPPPPACLPALRALTVKREKFGLLALLCNGRS